MKVRISLSLLLLCAAIVITYQNCGDVSLVQPPRYLATNSVPPFSVEICSDVVNNEIFHFHSAIVTNLNVQPYQGKLYPDSDADGIRDAAESGEYVVGTRTSKNSTIDSLCMKGNATCGSPCADSPYIYPGITLCDYAQFSGNLQPALVDADSDGLPTFFEILRGGYPANSDATLSAGEKDADADGAYINEELLGMTDPFWFDAPEGLARYHPRVTETTSTSCKFPKKMFRIEMPSLPRVDVAPFVDIKADFVTSNTPISLSHLKNENIYLVILEMKSVSNTRFLINRFVVGPESGAPKSLTNQDFVLLSR